MPASERLLKKISGVVLSEAREQARDIIQTADSRKEQELREFSEQLVDRLYSETQQAVAASKQKKRMDITLAEQEEMRALLRRQQELLAQMVIDVKKELLDYAETEEYRQQMLEEIRELKSRWDHSASVVSLRPRDLSLAEDIKAILPGCAVAEDPAMQLGGFILENRAARIRVDASLAGRLEEQREWFLEHCDLRIE